MAEQDVLDAIAALQATLDKLFDGTGIISVKSISVVNADGDAVRFEATGANGSGLRLLGQGSGHGLYAYGGSNGAHGIFARGNGSGGSGVVGLAGPTGDGIRGYGGSTYGAGIRGEAQNNGSGMRLIGRMASPGLEASGGVTGDGILSTGGETSGTGIKATVGAGNDGDGILAVGAGAGHDDIRGDITGNISGGVDSIANPVTVGINNDKTGYALTTDYDITTDSVAAAVWNHLTSAATTAGSIGKRLVDFVATLVYTAPDNASVGAIKAKTDNLPSSPAATGDAMTLTPEYDHAKDDVLTPLAAVDGKVDTILAEDVGADLGTDTCTITLHDASGGVVADARVYVSSDPDGLVRSDIRVTDALGQVRFDLTDGETYYRWAFSTRVSFTNPIEFVAVAD